MQYDFKNVGYPINNENPDTFPISFAGLDHKKPTHPQQDSARTHGRPWPYCLKAAHL